MTIMEIIDLLIFGLILSIVIGSAIGLCAYDHHPGAEGQISDGLPRMQTANGGDRQPRSAPSRLPNVQRVRDVQATQLSYR